VIVSLIVAMDESGGIGKHNQLPWRLPSDMKRFKRLTMGHYIIMGRKTYESIGKPLPGRSMIVVTHQEGYVPTGCIVMNSLSEAIKLAEDNNENELFIIGGGEIFNQAIGLADKIYMTTIHAHTDADVFFPKLQLNRWNLVGEEKGIKGDKDEFMSDFRILSRKV
jgi:dihydrofolate reductase